MNGIGILFWLFIGAVIGWTLNVVLG